MKSIIFYIFSALLLLSAGMVVTVGNLFYCALCLTLSLICVAGLFLLLGAEFLAVVQVLIYVGAITVLIVFAILLTKRLADKTIQPANRLKYFSALIIGLLLPLMIPLLWKTDWVITAPAYKNSISDIGNLLMGQYALPFEVVSILLLVALVGAIALAKKGKSVS